MTSGTNSVLRYHSGQGFSLDIAAPSDTDLREEHPQIPILTSFTSRLHRAELQASTATWNVSHRQTHTAAGPETRLRLRRLKSYLLLFIENVCNRIFATCNMMRKAAISEAKFVVLDHTIMVMISHTDHTLWSTEDCGRSCRIATEY